MTKLSVRDLSLSGKKVLMRVDFNVPLNAAGQISDDSRIQAALPTIRYILDQGASLVLMSHLGRPKSKKVPSLSLAPVAKRLSELLQKPVAMAPDCIGPEVEKMASSLKAGEMLLLENLRFYPGEEKPKEHPDFVASLAKLGEIYVNDAFGTAHRAHASTALIAEKFPEKAAMGFLIQKELDELSKLLEPKKRPFYAIIGGAKISTKAGVIESLLEKVDALFVGGAMAFTFFKARGISVGTSLVEDEQIPTIRRIEEVAKKKNIPLYLPLDFVIADDFKNEAKHQVVSAEEGIPDGWQGMDIGPKTIHKWSELLSAGGIILWNGPLGVFEMPTFAQGTEKIASALATSKAEVVVGGGDSVAAIHQAGLSQKFSHLSTGGGATLEFLEFGHLPGIDSLSEKK